MTLKIKKGLKMKKFERLYKPLPWLSALALTALLAGCGGGGQAPILGAGGAGGVPNFV